jgi:ElaB/YqjD/DUF883 family membrane-anchored ribosome-binding protein
MGLIDGATQTLSDTLNALRKSLGFYTDDEVKKIKETGKQLEKVIAEEKKTGTENPLYDVMPAVKDMVQFTNNLTGSAQSGQMLLALLGILLAVLIFRR